MATIWVKLETNIPVVGTCRAAYFMKSKKEGWADQIGLYGEWAKKGPDNGSEMVDSAVAVPAPLAQELVDLGVFQHKAHDGENRFDMRAKDIPIKILKREQGKKKWTEVTFLDGSKPKGEGSETGDVASVPPQNGEIKPPVMNNKERWLALEADYARCLFMATRAWRAVIEKQDDPMSIPQPSPETLQAAAATMLIAANQRGLTR